MCSIFLLAGWRIGSEFSKGDANQILFKLGIEVIVITMGKKGAWLINSEKSELIKPIKVDKVIDTTGAGDAFSTGFIYGFIKNLSFKFEDLKFNVKIGNFIAGKCIQELGARNGIPTTDEIDLQSLDH